MLDGKDEGSNNDVDLNKPQFKSTSVNKQFKSEVPTGTNKHNLLRHIAQVPRHHAVINDDMSKKN